MSKLRAGLDKARPFCYHVGMMNSEKRRARIGFNDVEIADFEIPKDDYALEKAIRDAAREYLLQGSFWVEFDNGPLYIITAHQGSVLNIMYVKER